MVRLFIALDLSEEIVNYLRELQEDLDDVGGRSFRFVKDVHLTLLFLGETSEELLPKMIEALDMISFEDFELQLEGIGIFPDERRARVVWVGLKENANLLRLHEDIDRSLDFLNLPKRESFHPHLTLARVKSLSDQEKSQLSEFLRRPTKPLKCKVSSFHLYKSTMTSEGSEYDMIEGFGR